MESLDIGANLGSLFSKTAIFYPKKIPCDPSFFSCF